MKRSVRHLVRSFVVFSFLAGVIGASAQQMLVPRNSTWRYNNANIDLGSTWRQPGFNDAAWSGPSPAPIGNNVEGGVQQCATVITINTGTAIPVIYYRRTFSIANAAAFQQLTLRLQRDDSAVVYLNGTLLYNDGVTAPGVFGYEAGQVVAGADEVMYREYFVPPTALVDGVNVLAVENHQCNSTSSDLQFDLELEGEIDTSAPTLVSASPPQGANLLALTFINTVFSEGVRNVDASDLTINGVPATTVDSNNLNDYTFHFPQPPTGTVQIAFVPGHGITDRSGAANPFAGGSWTYNLDTNASTRPNIVISEFLAGNDNGLRDDDGQRNDWLELYNQGPLDANLNGWFLTDTLTNLTKWRIPAVALGNNDYVLIWCSQKNRANLNAPLHTSFRLGKDAGGFLALVDPQTNIVSAFTNYPAQTDDISYGRDRLDPNLTGFFSPPTPGAQNTSSGAGAMGAPVFSLASGVYTNASLSLTIANTNGSGTIRYTTDKSVPTASSPAYTGPINITQNDTIKARIFPPAGTNLLPSAIVARNFVFLDNTSQTFSSRLPTMIISTEGQAIPSSVPPGSPRAKGSIVIIDTVQGRSSITGGAQVHELADLEIFGQTSEGFAKKPIRVEIQDANGNDLDVEVLGMPADSDWRLRNPYNDKTMMNDFLGYELWEKMGHYSVRRRFVEVFLDTGGGRTVYPGDYYGVMVLCETIKVNNDRVDIPKITPYSTNLNVKSGGFIFKRDKVSTGDLDFTSPGGPGFVGIPLKLHEPKPNDMRSAGYQGVSTVFPGPGYTPSGTNQMTYLRNFLGRMEQALYAANWTNLTGTNHYSYYLDPIAFADQMLHVEFTKQIDGYRLSDYFTKGNDGRIGPGPVWDWNLAFGNADYAQGGMTNTWYYEITGEADHPWARRLIAGTAGSTASSGDANFTQLIADRWGMFRTNVLNGTNMLQRIDEVASLLSESAARDLYGKYRQGLIGTYTWPNPSGVLEGRDVDYVRPTNYLGPIETVAPATATNSIIGQMKKWMLGRYLWMDSQFATPPHINKSGAMVTNGYTVTITPSPGTTMYYTLNGTDPRLSGGGVNPAALTSTTPVTVTVNANIKIVARVRRAGTWKNTWSGPAIESFFTTIPSLRITEIMFNPVEPPLGSTNEANDFEYIEVKNIGAVPLNVNGYTLAGGVQFQFPNEVLAAGESAVIVANVDAFVSRYGAGRRILGTFTGSLNNAGDSLALNGGLGEGIHSFIYEDDWFPVTDGSGFSLVVVNENASPGDWGLAGNWRASAAINGSPGQVDPAPPARPAVVVNEIRANGGLQAGDIIELYNTTGSPADISGWFLTDDFDIPGKYTIPPGTIIPANGYLVFYETNSFGIGSTSFGLGADGDDVYIFSGNGVSLTGYAHGFDFGASASNTTLGRYVISTGNDHLVAQSSSTLGGANAAPLVGPVVISEISYHPADTSVNGIPFNNFQDEFIELHNTSGAPIPLFDPANPTHRWELTNTVTFRFPANVTLAAGGYLLVVGFDPSNASALAAFRARNYVPANIPVYGPWAGNLGNDGGRIDLSRPDAPVPNGSFSQILVERVNYGDAPPWSPGADGLGLTLQRIVSTSYGNDPTNWVAAAPTPGGNFVPGGIAPAITSQPGNQLFLFGSSADLTVTATGTAPLRYQWRFNGANLPNATNATLVLGNFQPADVGTYSVLVYNSGGYALGTNFVLSGRTELQITSHPQDSSAEAGESASFTVGAVGTGTLRYQWRHDGVVIPNGTNATLTILGVQTTHEGAYTVTVSDNFDSLVSNPATLTVVAPPVRTQQPFHMTVVEGSDVSMSVAALGTTPISFRWRTNGVNISNVVFVVTPSNSTIVITNISTNFTGLRFTVAITNIAGQAPLTTNALLTVLADTDRDGLPDVWEAGRPGFGVNDASDGTRDDDNDGMKNGDEYFAGTDPFDAGSFLKVQLDAAGQTTVHFMAVSNRTYSVEFTDGLQPPVWQKLEGTLVSPTNRPVELPDASAVPNRFYRLVTPVTP